MEEEFDIFRKEYLNTREKRIQWSGEFEVDGKLNVLDMVCMRIGRGISGQKCSES